MALPRRGGGVRFMYHHRTSGEEPSSYTSAAIVDSLRAPGHTVDIVGPTPGLRSPGEVPLAASRTACCGWWSSSVRLAYNLKSIIALGLRRGAGNGFHLRAPRAQQFRGPRRLAPSPGVAPARGEYALCVRVGKCYGLKLARIANALTNGTGSVPTSHIFTVTHAQVPILQQIGAAASRITVLPQRSIPRSIPRYPREALRSKLGLEGIVAGFVGTMNRWQGMGGFADGRRVARPTRTCASCSWVAGRAPEPTRLLEAEGLSEAREVRRPGCRTPPAPSISRAWTSACCWSRMTTARR